MIIKCMGINFTLYLDKDVDNFKKLKYLIFKLLIIEFSLFLNN